MNMQFFTINSSGNTLVGTQHIGDGSKSSCVLIIHGYLSANRIGPYRMYLQIANLANEMGYDVFRVDFAGCGESTDNGKITLNSFYQNFLDTLAYVRKRFKRVILIGHCLGANIVVYQNSIDKSNFIEKCIAISPTPTTAKNLLKIFTPEQIETAKKNHGFERRGLFVDESFLGGLSNLDVFEKGIKKNNNLYIFLPELDGYVDVPELIAACERAHVNHMVLPFADHHVLNSAARNIMFTEITNFIQK